jgi:glycosyltransferase involved in cell wall biosynthesis
MAEIKPTVRIPGAEPVHVLILVQNLPVPFDRRVWQEALALTEAGYKVHVICPATEDYPRHREVINEINIYRYEPVLEARRSAGYLAEYSIAIFSQLRLALSIRRRYPVKIAHVCNPPDLLFLAVLPLLPLGCRIIYDHHDACPELMAAKGHSDRSLLVGITRLAERLTYRLATVSIETNESYKRIALGRGRMPSDRVFVVRSAPMATRFARARPDEKWRGGRKYLVAYVGVMGIQDGLDYLIDAARVIVQDRGQRDVRFVLIGSGPEFARLRDRVESLGLGEHVTLTGRLPDEDLGSILMTADVCVNPDEANSLNDISTMNKVLEYMALGKPIVQFDLREGRFSAGAASLYATGNDPVSMADCITSLLDDHEMRTMLGEYGRQRFTTELSWEAQVPVLLAAYERALRGPGRRSRHSSEAGRPNSRSA